MVRVKPDRLILVAVLLLAVCFGALRGKFISPQRGSHPASSSADQTFADAFENRRSNVQVRGEGSVSKILPDDNQGSRHQRFVIKLDPDRTVLIALYSTRECIHVGRQLRRRSTQILERVA